MEQNQAQEFEPADEIDIKRILDLLRRWAWLLVLAALLGAAAAFVVSKLQTPIYEANTQVMITRSSSSSSPVTDITQALNSQQIADTYVQLLTQDWVLTSVATRVGGLIDKNQVKVSAATNTQIINITVDDPLPARAVSIANTLVQVLIEQNDNLQSGRYTSAENSLTAQIDQINKQISDTQAQIKQATADALTQQTAGAQAKIQTTQAAISADQAEIGKLKALSPASAGTALTADQNRLKASQTALTQQLADYQALQAQQASDPKAAQDPTLQAQAAALEAAVKDTQAQIASLQAEIDWLTPLVEPGALAKALAARQDDLTTQQDLLAVYQKNYTDLLASGKIQGSSDEITNLQNNLTLYQQIYLSTLNNRETVRQQRMQNMPNVVQINSPTASADPVRPRVLLNTLLGGLAGLMLAFGAVFLVESLDDSIKTADQINERLKLPVIGYIAEIQRGPETAYVAEHPRSPVAEAFRTLRTNLEFANVDKEIKILLVVSPNPAEGKTSIAVNLAITLAQGGKHVLLIDADLRRPRIHHYLGLTNRKGLSDMFRSSALFPEVVTAWKDKNLAVVTSGSLPPNPADILASEKMGLILEAARNQADIVVIDAPPFLVADASILASHADGVLLVIRPGKTSLETALFTVEQMKRAGARVIGVVMNRIPRNRAYNYGGYPNIYADYKKGYGHYYSGPELERSTPAVPAVPAVPAAKREETKPAKGT